MFKAPLFVLALAGTVLSVPVLADEQAPAPAAVESPKKEKTVCRRENFVGSNVPKKMCHTESEWRAIDAQDQRNFSDRDRNDK